MHSKHLSAYVFSPTSSDIRSTFTATDDGSLVGSGTVFPLGLTIAELTRLFRQIKSFTVSGTLPGQTDTTTELVGYPASGLRQFMFCISPPIGNESPPSQPVISMGVFGYLFDGKYYPPITFTYVGGAGLVGGSYALTKVDDFDSVGVVNIIDKTIPLYPQGESIPPNTNPPGDVTFEVEEEWTE